jgi:hypothetical protein
LPHATLIVNPLVDIVGKVGLRLRNWQPLDGRSEATLGVATVPNDVCRNPVEPRQHLVSCKILIPSAPRLEKDDRNKILGLRLIAHAAEAVVVDPLRVTFKENAKRIRVAFPRSRPQNVVVKRHHLYMSGAEKKFPMAVTIQQ